MELSSEPVAAWNTSIASLPPELTIFLDFISDDDRPTFVLEQSTTPRIVFRNTALDVLLEQSAQNSSFLNWVDTLSNIAGDCTAAQHLQRIDELGTFASRSWSSKRIGGAWTAVFCRQDHDYNKQVDTPTESWPTQLRDAGLLEQGAPQDQFDLDNMSSSGSSTFCSQSTFEMNTVPEDTAGQLEEKIVGWLSFPHLTPDPWIHFLVKHDWDKTTIGPLRNWPPPLRQMYTTILSSAEPRVLYWGNELCMFYNEAAAFLVGEMHPYPLGNRLVDVWGAPMFEELAGVLRSGIKRGKPLQNKRRELVITRYGFPESAFFDFTFLPIPSLDGHFMAFVNEFTEITDAVVQENRHEVTKTILDGVAKMTDMHDLWTALVNTLGKKSMDVSYAIVYSYPPSVTSDSDTEPLRLQASFGIEGLDSGVPDIIAAAVQRSTNNIVTLKQRKNTLPLEMAVSIPDVGRVNTACVVPIAGFGARRLSAIVVLGFSPLRPLTTSGRQFAESLRDLLFKSAAFFALPSEQQKVQETTSALSQQVIAATMKADRSEQNFTRMVHDAPIGMCMNRSDGFPVYVNDAYLKLLGVSRAGFYMAGESGFAWRNFIFEDDCDTVDTFWKSAIASREPARMEFRVKPTTSSPDTRWLEAVVQQRYDDNDNILFLYGWLTDISSRKLTEFLIDERLADALETKRSSENFIDMVSHEMRNPLSSILQLADNVLLSLPPSTGDDQPSVLTEDARHLLIDTAHTITLCAKHQKGIIDEVLTFSKLDSKLLVLAFERVQPPTIVESVLKMVKAELEHADIHGSMVIQQSYIDLAVDHVLLDPGRLSQVILNLLTNAIKFTQGSHERQITVSLAASRKRPTTEDCHVTLIEPRGNRPDDAQQQPISTYEGPVGEDVYLSFSVQDSGCGLTEDEIKHLFHRFSQASPKTYKQYGGSGLGLFISRELTELQGGQVGVFSESGKGSTFAFYVKASRVDPPSNLADSTMSLDHAFATLEIGHSSTTEETSAPTTTQDLHVLVVEDNAINQKVMAQQLRRLGCAKVHVADHGLDALNLLSTTTFFGTVEEGKIPLSVVLLDVEMPIMDGLTCARRIRELQRTGEILCHVPIIGITANARPDQIASCIDAGMDEVVTKPFRMPQLIPRMLALADKYKVAD